MLKFIHLLFCVFSSVFRPVTVFAKGIISERETLNRDSMFIVTLIKYRCLCNGESVQESNINITYFA